MFTILKIINIIGICIAFVNIVLVAKSRSFRGQKLLLLSAFSLLVHIVGVYLEFTSVSLESALNGLKIQYLVAGDSALFLMMFLFEYCGKRCPKRLWLSMLCFNAGIFLMVLFCEHHSLYYREIRFVTEGFYPHIETEKGVFYYIFMAQLVAVVAISLVVTIRHCRKNVNRINNEVICMAAAVGVPCVVKVLHGIGIMGVYDPTMLATIVSSLLLILSVSRYNMTGIEEQGKSQFVDEMQEGFLMVDKDFGFVSANKKARQLFPELEKMQLGDRVTGLDDSSMLKIVTGRNLDREINGGYYEFRVTPLEKNGEKRGYIICVFDVTAAHTSYVRLSELKERAESASKAKEIFLANMSHEIRTPMNAIVGMSSLLLEEKELGGSAREYVRTIQASSETLLGLINDVLDFSKIESGKVEIVEEAYSVSEAVRDVCSIMKGRAEQKQLYFNVSVAERVPKRLIGDIMRIKQIMLNLLGNAVKFTEKGGISMEIDWSGEQGGMLSVKVSDTGIGIKECDYNRLFVDFSRVKDKKVNYIEGTGLGLSICRRMLVLMNGTINVESVYGEGSCFSFELPQKKATDDGSETEAAASAEGEGSLEGVTVMVVDDNNVNLRVTKGLLEALLAVPVLKSGGEEAVEYIKAGEKLPSIILMDYMMPGMDGIEAAKAIRSLGDYGRNVTIIALTADAVKGEKEKFLKNGFNGYLSKPIDLQKLGDYLKRFAPVEEKDSAILSLKRSCGEFLDIDGGIGRYGRDGYLQRLGSFSKQAEETVQRLTTFREKGEENSYRSEAARLNELGKELFCKRLEKMSAAISQGSDTFIKTNCTVYEDFLLTLGQKTANLTGEK